MISGISGVRRIPRRQAARIAAVAAGLLFAVSPARAHPLAPSLLRIAEGAAGQADVTWKTPRRAVPGSRLRPVLPAYCVPLSPPEVVQDESAWIHSWRIDCGERGLGDADIAADGIPESMTDVVVHVELADGRVYRTILTDEQPRWTVPEVQGATEVFFSYLRYGFDHILSGHDHLAFVFALMLLVRARRLVQVLTAFTLGHSVTLALSALDVVRVPQRPVEILIALSIAIAAWEVVRLTDARRTGFTRLPMVMAATFGLLHGLGFAGALREVGLPQEAIPLSLFSFNVGIELGQLAFVALALVPATFVATSLPLSRAFRRVSAYLIGSLAFYWVFERALA